MASTRQDKAIAYAVATLLIGAVFAASVWVAAAVSASAASENRLQEVLRRQRLIADRADGVIGRISTYIDSGFAAKITSVEPSGVIVAPGQNSGRRGVAAADSIDVLNETVRLWLRDIGRDYFPPELPDYLAVFSRDNKPLFTSVALSSLWGQIPQDSIETERMTAAVYRALDSLAQISPNAGHTVTEFFGRKIMFIAQYEPSGASKVSHVIAGTALPENRIAFETVVATLAIVTPILALIALYVGHRITGHPMRPVEHMINELEAITDGRSLHRRLAVDPSSVELARLAGTLNEMMGRLEKSFGALRTFTADASHELNTPLAVLRADVERAMNPKTGVTDRMIALEEALREIRRMTDLVDSLLTLARADEGRLDLHREPVDLAALVRDVHETALLLAEDAQITVKLATLEDATVLGDETRLRQLFLNLISNAIKYTPTGGRVELSLTHRLDGVAFTVRDTGIGIAAADLPHIFERFWRADHARSRVASGDGFGLGLPICYWIAQAHGGSLSATSRLGKGSAFTVTLPLDPAWATAHPRPLSEEEQLVPERSDSE